MARGSRRSLLRRRRGAPLTLALLLIGASAAAPLEVEDLSGAAVRLAPREGRPLVIHFWATWCPSCAEELPELVRASSDCAGSLEIALVDVGDAAEEIQRFLSARGIALAVLRDPDGHTWRAAVGGWGLPANLVWTAEGRRSEVGPRSAAQWRDLLGELGCAISP